MSRSLPLPFALCCLLGLPWPKGALGDWYLAASAGEARIDERVGSAELDDEDFAFKLGAGWRVNKSLAFEVGYIDLGSFDGSAGSTDFEFELQGFSFHGVVGFPLGRGFAPFARVGYFYWESETQVAGQTSDDSGWEFVGGLGLSYTLNERWALRGEWERYDSDADVDVYTAGVLFRF